MNWFNNKRLHINIGGVPPAEHKAVDYAQTQPNPEAGAKTEAFTKPGAPHGDAMPSQGRIGALANPDGEAKQPVEAHLVPCRTGRVTAGQLWLQVTLGIPQPAVGFLWALWPGCAGKVSASEVRSRNFCSC